VWLRPGDEKKRMKIKRRGWDSHQLFGKQKPGKMSVCGTFFASLRSSTNIVQLNIIQTEKIKRRGWDLNPQDPKVTESLWY